MMKSIKRMKRGAKKGDEIRDYQGLIMMLMLISKIWVGFWVHFSIYEIFGFVGIEIDAEEHRGGVGARMGGGR